MKSNGWKAKSKAILNSQLIPPGYKQTEVGLIPEDWILKRVGDLATSIASGRSHVDSGFGDYPVYGSTGIIGRCSQNDYSGRAILIARVGANAGKLSVVDGEYGVTDNTIIVRVNDSSHMDYFWRQLEAKRLNSMVFGSGQPLITGTQIKSLVIPLPPTKAEQKAIARVLGNADALIDSLEQLIAAKTEFKHGLMQQLLTGRRRFSEFIVDRGSRPTQYGPVPNDWNYLHIGDFAWEVTRKNPDGNEFTVLSCTKHHGLVDSLKYFGKRVFSENLSAYKVVNRGQFAYATNHIEEGSIGYQDLYDEALISPMYTVFETNEKVDHSFFFKLLKTELYRHIFEVNTSGSIDRRGGLRWRDFARIKIALPSRPEQRRIAAVLEACDRELDLLREQLVEFKQQKQGLMQKLLTGQIRVNVNEAQATSV